MHSRGFSLIQALIAALIFTIGIQTTVALFLNQQQQFNQLRKVRNAWRLLLNCSAIASQQTPMPSTLVFDWRGQIDPQQPLFKMDCNLESPHNMSITWNQGSLEKQISLTRIMTVSP